MFRKNLNVLVHLINFRRAAYLCASVDLLPYSHGNRENVDPVRTRKLLLTAREIRKLSRATETTGMTLVPTRAYLRGGWVKIEIAVARGKKTHDKRESTRKREMQREMDRERGSRGARTGS